MVTAHGWLLVSLFSDNEYSPGKTGGEARVVCRPYSVLTKTSCGTLQDKPYSLSCWSLLPPFPLLFSPALTVLETIFCVVPLF